MTHKGAGGRWHDDDDPEASREADAALAPPSSLGAVEVACFASIIGLLFWLARELSRRGAGMALFQGLSPERHVFASLAIAVAAFMFGLGGTHAPRQTRVAGAMLASVVSVALLYVLLFLGQNLYVAGGCIALAAGSALRSRTGLTRNEGYPAALVGASILVIAHAVMARMIH